MTAAVLPWLPIATVLFFFTVPRREVLRGDRGSYRLEVTQGFRTRVVDVRDVRVEADADTKRPSLVIETAVNVEHFDLEATHLPDLRTDGAPLDVVLLGPAWLRLFAGLVTAEVLLVAYFALAQRELRIDLEDGTARIVERRLLRRPIETNLAVDAEADAESVLDAYRASRG